MPTALESDEPRRRKADGEKVARALKAAAPLKVPSEHYQELRGFRAEQERADVFVAPIEREVRK